VSISNEGKPAAIEVHAFDTETRGEKLVSRIYCPGGVSIIGRSVAARPYFAALAFFQLSPPTSCAHTSLTSLGLARDRPTAVFCQDSNLETTGHPCVVSVGGVSRSRRIRLTRGVQPEPAFGASRNATTPQIADYHSQWKGQYYAEQHLKHDVFHARLLRRKSGIGGHIRSVI